jgi:hypothetical protein
MNEEAHFCVGCVDHNTEYFVLPIFDFVSLILNHTWKKRNNEIEFFP